MNMRLPFDMHDFLPLERMAQLRAPLREAYAGAQPYPHVVIDDFFEPALLERVLGEFPSPGAIDWQRFDSGREIKLASAAEAGFGAVTRLLLYHLNSITFLDFMSSVTGIADLIPDPCYDGGGLHQIERGGKLGIHADFNKHPRYGLDRRLNLLVYLNREWRDEYGGHLELWDRDMQACRKRIAPHFNRVVVFGTTDFTYHGHPDALQCPPGATRKSLALYYFSNGRPADEVSGRHSTLFRERNVGDFRPAARQRMRSLAADLLPPIVTRTLKRWSDGARGD
jgi:hypothetical protein